MKSEPQVTKAHAAKLEAMKKIKASYSKAKKEGSLKTYQESQLVQFLPKHYKAAFLLPFPFFFKFIKQQNPLQC